MSYEEEVCADVLAQTHAFYLNHHTALGNRGYEVLYGPPLRKPEIFFLGFQPGGGHSTEEHQQASPTKTWPKKSYYGTEQWRLAKVMQAMFGTALLERCTGANAIFFRAPSMRVYYLETPVELLAEIDLFCRKHLLAIIEALEPKLIVAIGFSALAQFGPGYPILTSLNGRSLVQIGAIGARRAYATLHLSGSRISDVDRNQIADFLRYRLGKVAE